MLLARILLGVWLLGVVRVIGAVLRGELLGGEVTIALLMTVLLPWVIWDVYSAQGRRSTERKTGDGSPEGRDQRERD